MKLFSWLFDKIINPISEDIILLYKTKYQDFNFNHFKEYLEEEEDGDEGGYANDEFGSDIIPIPDFPTVSALGTEFVNIYLPTL